MTKTKSKNLTLIMTVCTLLFCCMTSTVKAGSITQAILADHFLRAHPNAFTDQEKDAFRSGTLFPDIFHICELNQKDTYFVDVTIDDILNEPSAFVAGMKFHSYVDALRENFIAEGGYLSLLSHLKKVKHKDTFLKFVEDEVVYSSLDTAPWQVIAQTIQPDELDWGVKQDRLDRWHYLLNLSYSYYPSTLIFLAHLKGNGLLNVPAKEIGIWVSTFDSVAKDENVKAYVNELFNMYSSHMN